MHDYAVTARQAIHREDLQRVTLASVAAPTQHAQIAALMGATVGKRDDVVNGQIVGPVVGHAVTRAPPTMPCPVLCHHLLSYSAVGTGIATLAGTATLPLTLCLVHSSTHHTAGRVGSQAPAHQAGTLSHGYCHPAGSS